MLIALWANYDCKHRPHHPRRCGDAAQTHDGSIGPDVLIPNVDSKSDLEILSSLTIL